MLIGIIQSEWCYRKISEETNLSKIDILLKKGRILLGAILIIIEIVIRMLYPSMFKLYAALFSTWSEVYS